VDCRYEPGSLGGPILFVQITAAGRKVVREGKALAPAKKLPVGTLREWHWRGLCRAYVQGDQGMHYDQDTGDRFGYVSWNTILRLRDYKVKGVEKSLVSEKRFQEEHIDRVAGYEFKRDYTTRLCITGFGRQHYCENWQRYCELYPDVDAPAPR